MSINNFVFCIYKFILFLIGNLFSTYSIHFLTAPTIFHHSIKQVHLQITLIDHNLTSFISYYEIKVLSLFGEDFVVSCQKFSIQGAGEGREGQTNAAKG